MTNTKEESTEVCDFEKAFRMFKKSKKEAESWNTEAVRVFTGKRLQTKQAPLNEWFKIFSSY